MSDIDTWKRENKPAPPSTIKLPPDLSALLVATQEEASLANRADVVRNALENHLASKGIEPGDLLRLRGFTAEYRPLMTQSPGYQPVRLYQPKTAGGEA
tara:strand:+ start:440 stop:736 length:297 start_codon:yes stop_codon:yes gene_type:complete